MLQSPRNRLLVGTLVLFVARLVLSLARTGPVLVADEIGYLTNARVLAGGLAGQLEQAPFYRGGYSLLIAPLVGIGGDPGFTYHLVLVLNAALAASVFPLLYLLLSRYGGVRPEVAIWAALAGAVYPALTVLSQVAMSENLLFPLVCVWLIAVGGLLRASGRGREIGWAAALAAATGALWAVHNRMIVAVALAVFLLLWLTARRRLRPAAPAVALAVIAACLVGVHFLDGYLIDHNYAGSAPDELSERMDDLLRLGGIRTALANLVGQAWYLLVATFGLAALAATDFYRRRRAGEADASLTLLGALLALTALLLAISAAAFPERTRPDMLIYGRYAEIAAPALIGFGLAALERQRLWRSLRRPLLGLAAWTLVVVLIRATASDPDAPNRWNISALPFLTSQLGAGILIGAALIAAFGAWLLVAAAAPGGRLLAPGAVAVGLLLAVVLYGVWNPVHTSEQAVHPDGWTSPQAVAERHDIRTVAYDLDDYDTIGLYAVQWFLPDTRVVLFRGGSRPTPSRFVIAGSEWDREHGDGRARELWADPGRDEVLWRVSPGCLDDVRC